MRATINQELLLRQLKKASICIKKNHVIPITSSVLFVFGKNILTITATDLETEFISMIDCECKTPFTVPIDHADITDICSNAVAPIIMELKDTAVLITSGLSKHKLPATGNAEDFPSSKSDGFDIELSVEAEFFYYLNNANSCKSKEELKVSLNMAAIDVKKDSVTVVGTDANYLYKKTMVNKSKKERVVMVSDTFVQSCKPFLDSKISIGEKFIKAEYLNETVISRLSDNAFANYTVVIPEEITYNLNVNKDELKSVLRSVIISTNIMSRAVVLNFIKDKIKLISQNIDFGKESENEVSADHTVPIDSICLNSGQLMHLLNIIDAEEIKLSISQASKTVYIQPKEDDSLLLLLQPLFNQN